MTEMPPSIGAHHPGSVGAILSGLALHMAGWSLLPSSTS